MVNICYCDGMPLKSPLPTGRCIQKHILTCPHFGILQSSMISQYDLVKLT